MKWFVLCLLLVSSAVSFAKSEGDCERQLSTYGKLHREFTQVGMFEIFYKDGTVRVSEMLNSGGDEEGQVRQKLDRISEKEINAFISSLKTSRDQIDHVKLHLYFPATDGYVSQIVRLK